MFPRFYINTLPDISSFLHQYPTWCFLIFTSIVSLMFHRFTSILSLMLPRFYINSLPDVSSFLHQYSPWYFLVFATMQQYSPCGFLFFFSNHQRRDRRMCCINERRLVYQYLWYIKIFMTFCFILMNLMCGFPLTSTSQLQWIVCDLRYWQPFPVVRISENPSPSDTQQVSRAVVVEPLCAIL